MSKSLLISSLLLFAMTACIAADDEPDSPRSLLLPEGSHDRTLTLEQGETFTVEIAGNITTGYQWKPVEQKDEKIVSVSDLGYRQQDPESKLMGAPGIFSFRIEALGPGTTAVEFAYNRPWEENAPPVYTVTIHVTVE